MDTNQTIFSEELFVNINNTLIAMTQACAAAMTSSKLKTLKMGPSDCILILSLDVFKSYVAFIKLRDMGIFEATEQWEDYLTNATIESFAGFGIMTFDTIEQGTDTVIVHLRKDLKEILDAETFKKLN